MRTLGPLERNALASSQLCRSAIFVLFRVYLYTGAPRAHAWKRARTRGAAGVGSGMNIYSVDTGRLKFLRRNVARRVVKARRTIGARTGTDKLPRIVSPRCREGRKGSRRIYTRQWRRPAFLNSRGDGLGFRRGSARLGTVSCELECRLARTTIRRCLSTAFLKRLPLFTGASEWLGSNRNARDSRCPINTFKNVKVGNSVTRAVRVFAVIPTILRLAEWKSGFVDTWGRLGLNVGGALCYQ